MTASSKNLSKTLKESGPAPKLKPLLEETLKRCNGERRRENDPVGMAWAFTHDEDREVVSLFASSLAYGRVDLLRRAIDQVLQPMGDRPAEFLRQVEPSVLGGLWDGFVYRMTRGPDITDLATAIQKTLRIEGSLENLYLKTPDKSRPCRLDRDSPLISSRAEHLARASEFVMTLRDRRRRPEVVRGFRYLLPDPADGSACKRLHLFFRWMARGPDLVDFGIWKNLPPAMLVMPLDTHTARLCRYLGLLERKSIDNKAAIEVSRRLQQFDPRDPLKYDFALCHLGISGRCIHRRSPEHCPNCPIEAACILPQHPVGDPR